MKLSQLHLVETRCRRCSAKLTSKDVESMDPSRGSIHCLKCFKAGQKKAASEQSEADNMAERGQDVGVNLFHVSQSIPDRGYDKDRGTPGWLMGEPSPGRSF
jgi:hypothetical protein